MSHVRGRARWGSACTPWRSSQLTLEHNGDAADRFRVRLCLAQKHEALVGHTFLALAHPSAGSSRFIPAPRLRGRTADTHRRNPLCAKKGVWKSAFLTTYFVYCSKAMHDSGLLVPLLGHLLLACPWLRRVTTTVVDASAAWALLALQYLALPLTVSVLPIHSSPLEPPIEAPGDFDIVHYHGPGDPVQDMPPQLRGHRASRPPWLGGDGQRHGLGLVRLLPLPFQPNPTTRCHIHTQPNAHHALHISRTPATPASTTLYLHTRPAKYSYLKHVGSLASFALVSSVCARLPRCLHLYFARLNSCSHFIRRIRRVRRAFAFPHSLRSRSCWADIHFMRETFASAHLIEHQVPPRPSSRACMMPRTGTRYMVLAATRVDPVGEGGRIYVHVRVLCAF